MGQVGHDGLAVPGHVILAHEPPFQIGDLSVHPATRQIQHGERRDTLEPRVMQVLVALARADGAIVTRDELAQSCWDGRIVGDDSINRVLSRIRRVAADFAAGGFTVETITKVGYRLVRADEAVPSGLPPAVHAAPAVERRRLMLGTGAVAALALGAVAFWPQSGGRGKPLPKAKSLFDQAVIIRQEDNRQALAYLREAVRISPEFGQAWGALALSYRSAIDSETPDRVAGFEERLREAAGNAERYDPGNSDAAIAMLPSGSFFGRWLAYESLYRNAVRRHPDHPSGYSLLASLLMDVGRWSDAVVALVAAKSRNSRSAIIRYKLIVALWAAGRLSAAEDELDEAMVLWPQHGAIWQTKIKLLSLSGRPKEALALANNLAARPLEESDAPDMHGRLLFLTALATRSKTDVGQAIDNGLRTARKIESARLNMALQATVLGRTELALGMLEGLYMGTGEWALSSGGPKGLSTHPLFQPHARPLWNESRFGRILGAVGLEQYWRESRTLPDYRRPA
jgi:DNA-binding winged helix-turn-helix (wHTH) protein/tetratricopeptide (TPR) repeat protein